MTFDFNPSRRTLLAAAGAGLAASAVGARALAQAAKPATLLNVSYDPTRELYQDINKAFIAFWKQRAGQDLKINQSHNGSGASARAVIDGLQADVVTLALAYDIDEISRIAKLLPSNWQSRLPDNSTPYTSTIVFLTRKGNPWKLRDWGDLIKPGIEVITPNPKTSGGARWNYLAAWAWAKNQPGGTDASAKAFIQKLYKQVPVLDTGARGATTTFTERRIGDVLLAWENEAYLALDELKGQFDIVTPPSSILAEPPVAVVDKNVDRHGTRTIAEAYLNFLYSPLAQDLIGKNHYRPRNAEAAAKYASKFPAIKLANINDFGGWTKAQTTHFADGGVFDQIYKG
jgi:sulfate transport system substrate-binding protein